MTPPAQSIWSIQQHTPQRLAPWLWTNAQGHENYIVRTFTFSVNLRSFEFFLSDFETWLAVAVRKCYSVTAVALTHIDPRFRRARVADLMKQRFFQTCSWNKSSECCKNEWMFATNRQRRKLETRCPAGSYTNNTTAINKRILAHSDNCLLRHRGC